MGSQQYIIMHDAQTTVSEGKYIICNNSTSLIISLGGTSTSFSCSFYGSLDDKTYFLYEGSKLGDSSILLNTTTTINEGFEFDVSGILYFKVKITAISNGNVTITGNAIND